jgi:hypothetical protein
MMMERMSLAVYVGSYTRFYAEVLRGLNPEDHDEDVAQNPDEIREGVDAWRAEISDSLLGIPFTWEESVDVPYDIVTLQWAGWASLQVLAAHVQQDQTSFPKKAVTAWQDDREWRKSTGDRPTDYAQVFYPWHWLPVELSSLAHGFAATGQDVVIGSSTTLLAELRLLNRRSFAGRPDDLARWRAEACDADGTFDVAARHGLAVMLAMAETSAYERRPMILEG